jgi:hypothetical protein
MWSSVLLVVLCAATASQAATPYVPSEVNSDSEIASQEQVCEVLKHPIEYVGHRVKLRGVVTSLEHGAYFEPYPACAKPEAIRVQDFPWDSYRRAGGQKGVGVLVTVDGTLAIRPTAISIQKRGGPDKQVVLSVRHVSDVVLAPRR